MTRARNIARRLEDTITQSKNIERRLEDIAEQLSQIEQELKETNNKVEVYQKASTQVVNLAFSLIASATVTVILTTVLRK